jgi:HdeA/HdeB family
MATTRATTTSPSSSRRTATQSRSRLSSGGIDIQPTGANAQAELKTYADAESFINAQALTCAQFVGTSQEDADLLSTWYSGWYNGLAKKLYINIPRAKEAEHETIVYCKHIPR